MKLRAGQKLGAGWHLQRRVAAGAIASVWTAKRDGGQPSDAILKVLNIKLQPDQQRAAERFEREAEKAAGMRCTYVPRVYEYGLAPSRQPFLALERLNGTPLSRVLELRGRLELHEVALLLEQLAKALEEAHLADMTHRELKAENVLVVGEHPFQVRLLGFGLAKELRIADETTRPNTAIGNILDKPPEELMGHAPVGPRTDLWALGALAYEALTGRRPFAADDLVEVRDRVQRGAFTRLDEQPVDGVPPALDAWFVQALAYEPDHRFARASDMVARWRDLTGEVPSFALSADDETTLVMASPALDPSVPMLLMNERPPEDDEDDDDDVQATLIRTSHVPPPPPRPAYGSYAPEPRPPLASAPPTAPVLLGSPTSSDFQRPSHIPPDVPSSDYVPAPTVRKTVPPEEPPAAVALRRRTRRAAMAALACAALAIGTYYALVGAATTSQPNAGILEPAISRVAVAMSNTLRSHALRLDRSR